LEKTRAVNGDVACFDVVISIADEFPYLVGEVNAVDKRYATDHNLGQLFDEVFVDFRSEEYSEQRKSEIAAHFGERFDRIQLDNVPMAPDSLIVVPENDIPALLESRENAKAYCDAVLNNLSADKETELMARLGKNLSDYQQSLMGFGKRELIDMAEKIAAMTDAHSYLTTMHGFDEDEIDFYLQFQNPLEMVADAICERNNDLEDLEFTASYVFDRSNEMLTAYPLMSYADESVDGSLRRFMNVDLFDFLGKIAEKTIIHYPNDWNIDKDTLNRAVTSSDANDRRLVWHVCSYSTHIKPERDVFIKDSGAFDYMTDYHQNDPDMFGYIVEVTGKNGQHVTGNVFEVGNYAEYANHIRDVALPLDAVTLTYSKEYGGVNSGKTVTVSRREYDNERHRVMSEDGFVSKLKWEPAKEEELNALLLSERSRRMSFPIGSMEAHVDKVITKITEVRAEPEKSEQSKAEQKTKGSLEKRIQAGKDKVKEYKANTKPTPHKKTEIAYD
jgi:hypothetical protein